MIIICNKVGKMFCCCRDFYLIKYSKVNIKLFVSLYVSILVSPKPFHRQSTLIPLMLGSVQFVHFLLSSP